MTQLFCFDASWCDRFRTRRRRRAIAGAYAGVLGALIITTSFFNSFFAVMPLYALLFAASILLNVSTRSIAELVTHALDEQQMAFRNAAYQRVYWPATMLAFLGGLLVARHSDWETALQAGALLWALLAGMPSLLAAWTLPREADDEE